MSKTNIAASIRQRLKNYAKGSNESFNLVLVRFGLERLLFRISKSQHADQFILKGASLFYCWTEQFHRPTRDIDFLSHGEATPERFETLFKNVIQVESPEDGLEFDLDSLQVDTIKDDQKYNGVRVSIIAYLEKTKINLQVDLGFGDAVTPAPAQVEFPVLLDLPIPKILAYQKETVIAEKFQAMVELGIANSRMKDFFDLWTFASRFEFSGEILVDAIKATFTQRETAIPVVAPFALTNEFSGDESKQIQWNAFAQKLELELELKEVTATIEKFIMPCMKSIGKEEPFRVHWRDGKWQPKKE